MPMEFKCSDYKKFNRGRQVEKMADFSLERVGRLVICFLVIILLCINIREAIVAVHEQRQRSLKLRIDRCDTDYMRSENGQTYADCLDSVYRDAAGTP